MTLTVGLKCFMPPGKIILPGRMNNPFPQIPGYPFITLGGIVATNSHGKSCDTHGTVRRAIKKIKLFHKIHGWLDLSENENKEIFELTIGGLGLTGTIIAITFQLEKIENVLFDTEIEKVDSLKDCSTKILNSKGEKNFVYSWNRADNFSNIVFSHFAHFTVL